MESEYVGSESTSAPESNRKCAETREGRIGPIRTPIRSFKTTSLTTTCKTVSENIGWSSERSVVSSDLAGAIP